MRKVISKFAFFVPYGNRKEILFWLIINSFLIILNIFSYSLLIPFFSGLINIDSLNNLKILLSLAQYFNLDTSGILNLLGVSAGLFIFTTNLILLLNEKIKFEIIRKLSLNISYIYISNFINSDYSFLSKFQKTNVFTRLLMELENLVTNIFYNTFDLISRVILIGIISLLLLIINFKITLLSILGFSAVIWITFFFLKNKLTKSGTILVSINEKRTSELSNIANNLSLLKLYNYSNFFISKFLSKTNNYFHVLTKSEVLKKIPRASMEVIFFTLILGATLIYLNYYQNNSEINSSKILILLSTYAIAAYRMMPSVQQIFYLLTEIKNNFPKLEKIYLEIKQLKFNRKKKIKYPKIKNKKIDNIVYFKDVSYSINNKTILKDFSISIRPDQSYCIWGPSGSGKTTFLLLMCGLLKPDSGSIELNGEHIYNYDDVSKIFSVAPEPTALLQNITVLKNIILKQNYKLKTKKEVNSLTNFLSIKKILNKNVQNNMFSSGEVKRMNVARSLSKSSLYKLLDEPTTNLDKKNEKIIKKLLVERIKKYESLIIVTHDPEFKKICHNIINIS